MPQPRIERYFWIIFAVIGVAFALGAAVHFAGLWLASA
jgi:hypothetical protein